MYKPYMITYDLNSPGQKYEKFIETIKSFGTCADYWESAFLVKTSLNSNEMYSKLRPYLDANDRLIIVEAVNNYHGWLTPKQWDFIKDNIFN